MDIVSESKKFQSPVKVDAQMGLKEFCRYIVCGIGPQNQESEEWYTLEKGKTDALDVPSHAAAETADIERSDANEPRKSYSSNVSKVTVVDMEPIQPAGPGQPGSSERS